MDSVVSVALVQRREIAAGTTSFYFEKPRRFRGGPGQLAIGTAEASLIGSSRRREHCATIVSGVRREPRLQEKEETTCLKSRYAR